MNAKTPLIAALCIVHCALCISLAAPSPSDHGDHFTDELFHDVKSKRMKDGFVMGIFRSRPERGHVAITVSADGLPSETVTLGLR